MIFLLPLDVGNSVPNQVYYVFLYLCVNFGWAYVVGGIKKSQQKEEEEEESMVEYSTQPLKEEVSSKQ